MNTALGKVLASAEPKIASGGMALSRATLRYATAMAESGQTDGPFLTASMRAAFGRLDSDISKARRRVRALPRETPGRRQVYAALGTLAQGYAELRHSYEAMGTQEGIDAADAADQHLTDGGDQLEALRRYLR